MNLNFPEIATKMLEDLECNQLEVILVPDCYDLTLNCRRVAICQNHAWYQEFCSLYTSGRKRPRRGVKHDTLIKRQGTIKALNRIIQGETTGVYVERILDFIEQSKEN